MRRRVSLFSMGDVRYEVDPDDPRAPSQELWDRLSEAERERIVASLPSEFASAEPPEGDPHFRSKSSAYQALDEHFRRLRRKVYLSAELPVYYPGERMIAPDLIAVLDVECHDRDSWVVSREGKGVDFALEIRVAGRVKKDFEENVERFAALGIPEYFAVDLPRGRLAGWRLPHPGARSYEALLPQGGRFVSSILGVELTLDEGRLRFMYGAAPLLDSRELLDCLSAMTDQAVRRAEEEARRAEEETRRATDHAQRAERLAARLRALGIDPDTLD